MTLNSKPLWDWVNERHAVYIRKSMREGLSNEALHVPAGFWDNNYEAEFRWAAKGYEDGKGGMTALSRDPIFNETRFCNVFRELDRVTAWVRYNIRRRYADHEYLWFMLAIARYINWPDTLEALMDPLSDGDGLDSPWPNNDLFFSPERLAAVLQHQADAGKKVYTGAYMIRAESNPKAPWFSWSKHRYIAEIVLGRLWEDRNEWNAILGDQPEGGLTIQAVWELFQKPHYIGWGPFMAYQVCVDLRHTRYLRNAPDINIWSALGPGSKRGLNRLLGRSVDAPMTQDEGLRWMRELWTEQDGHRAPWVPPIELSDIQNCLCETDKYLRVKLGEGKTRARYVPGRGY